MADRRFLIVDIETRVDKALIRTTQYADPKYTDITTPDLAYQQYKLDLLYERQGRSDFIPVTYHVPISIAVGYVGPDYTLQRVETVGRTEGLADPFETFDDDTMRLQHEQAMVEEFWALVNEGYTLVTFNGRGFDLPVLELAALRYGIQAPRYWNEKFGHRYRFSEDGHYDLQDVLTNAGAAHLRGGLNALLTMLGYVGKDGVDGSKIQDLWEKGEHETIHTYCRRDVICTYALFIRLELIRGRLTPEAYRHAAEASRPLLAQIRERA